MTRIRLDRFLVEHALAESSEKAQAFIMAGEVMVNGQKALKPGQPVPEGAQVELLAKSRYVSRGGFKLEHALRCFGISPAASVCADFGTSTGGFTDCLLQHGALRVHAIDTGSGQIHWRLRTDPRVVLHESTNARFVEPATLGEAVELAVCDVSFISSTLVIPAMARVLTATGRMIVLVKPQFEVAKGQVGPGGIVRDPAQHAESCAKVNRALEELGFRTKLAESPITGTEGNKEFLMFGEREGKSA